MKILAIRDGTLREIRGMHSSMCVEDGGTSCLYHHVASTYDSRIVETPGQFCLYHQYQSLANQTSCRARALRSHLKPFPELTKLDVWMADVVPVLPDSRICPTSSVEKHSISINSETTLGHSRFWVLFTRRAPAFRSPQSRPLPPPTRFVLLTLTTLIFKGVSEHLEDLLARMDAPLLDDLYIEFFMDLDFNVPQLHRLIAEEFKTFDRADVWTFNSSIRLGLYPNTAAVDNRRGLELQASCRESDYQLSSLCQVCSSSFPLISALDELHIREHDSLSSSHWKDDMENAQCLELLDPFTALKNLYLMPMESHDVFAVPFKSLPKKGQLKSYPPYGIFSYGVPHWNLSRKP
jgi:hypothetical protein